MKQLLPALLLLLQVTVSAQLQKKYSRTPTGYLMVLNQGDSLLPALEQLAVKENIPSASLTGIGFAGAVRLGFFNASKKDFDQRDFATAELTSLTGSIAWKDGKPSIHAHVTIADKEFRSHGGHLLSCVTGTGSLEVYIVVYQARRERKYDEGIGADILQP